MQVNCEAFTKGRQARFIRVFFELSHEVHVHFGGVYSYAPALRQHLVEAACCTTAVWDVGRGYPIYIPEHGVGNPDVVCREPRNRA